MRDAERGWVAPAAKGGRPDRATSTARLRTGPELPGPMRTIAGAHTLKTAGLTGGVGGCAAALVFVHTGLIAAVPAATGLTALAATDLTSHRFSLRTLRLASALVAAGLLVDTARRSAWDQLAGASAILALLATALLAAWMATRGLSFGDILLVTFAVAVPAWISPRAAGVTLLVALVAAAGITLVQRRRRPVRLPGGTVALGPALLAGWVVAMVVG